MESKGASVTTLAFCFQVTLLWSDPSTQFRLGHQRLTANQRVAISHRVPRLDLLAFFLVIFPAYIHCRTRYHVLSLPANSNTTPFPNKGALHYGAGNTVSSEVCSCLKGLKQKPDAKLS
jgi:hypothetical protein